LSLFDLPHDPDPSPGRPLSRIPRAGLGLLAGVLAVAIVGERLAVLPQVVVPVAGVAAGHGALLMVAFASAAAEWRRPTLVVVSLLAIAAGLSRGGAAGALAYLLVPAAVWHFARRGRGLGAMGITAPVSLQAAVVGLLMGLCLGGHLLFSASRTLGYAIGGVSVEAYLIAVAYDVGANVVSAECFFRGTLFDGIQRRSTFWLAAGSSTLAEVVRYLLDPSLARSVEAITGAVFYIALLGMASCALFRWSGSLVPGALGRLGFFAAYRSLAGW
jgi:hypothetical protein